MADDREREKDLQGDDVGQLKFWYRQFTRVEGMCSSERCAVVFSMDVIIMEKTGLQCLCADLGLRGAGGPHGGKRGRGSGHNGLMSGV